MRRTFLCDGHGQKNSIISIKRFDIVLKKHIAGVRITNLFAVLSRKFSTAARHSIHTLQFLVLLLLLLFLPVFITVVFFGQRCDSLSAACLCVCVCIMRLPCWSNYVQLPVPIRCVQIISNKIQVIKYLAFNWIYTLDPSAGENCWFFCLSFAISARARWLSRGSIDLVWISRVHYNTRMIAAFAQPAE